jgi:tRNA 2-thiouridine synthesizing protein A
LIWMSINRNRPERTLNCVGMHCPEPVLRARIELDRMAPGELLEVLSDDPEAEEDIKRLAARLGHEVIGLEHEEDKIRLLIRRGGGNRSDPSKDQHTSSPYL